MNRINSTGGEASAINNCGDPWWYPGYCPNYGFPITWPMSISTTTETSGEYVLKSDILRKLAHRMASAMDDMDRFPEDRDESKSVWKEAVNLALMFDLDYKELREMSDALYEEMKAES